MINQFPLTRKYKNKTRKIFLKWRLKLSMTLRGWAQLASWIDRTATSPLVISRGRLTIHRLICQRQLATKNCDGITALSCNREIEITLSSISRWTARRILMMMRTYVRCLCWWWRGFACVICITNGTEDGYRSQREIATGVPTMLIADAATEKVPIPSPRHLSLNPVPLLPIINLLLFLPSHTCTFFEKTNFCLNLLFVIQLFQWK